MARIYCTAAEYNTIIGTMTTQQVSVFARASRVIDLYLRSAVYAVDSDGYPTNPDIRQALREATAYQVEEYERASNWWVNMENSANNPLGRALASATIDGTSWTADTSVPAKTYPRAADYLAFYVSDAVRATLDSLNLPRRVINNA